MLSAACNNVVATLRQSGMYEKVVQIGTKVSAITFCLQTLFLGSTAIPCENPQHIHNVANVTGNTKVHFAESDCRPLTYGA